MEYKWTGKWPGNFEPGNVVKVNGTPLHNGKTGTVVEWNKVWGVIRRGLVPVFMPQYPATSYWWIAPGQLKLIEAGK